ncbi:MAG: hypothetical protein U5K75_11115 [Ahrensia sp.]|nr:hypothetical protein [Ahrensia sp.]
MRFSRHPGWQDDLEILISAGKVHRTQAGGLFVERALLEAQRAFDLWERKSRGGKVSKNQNDSDGRVKSLGKTHSKTLIKSAASNQNQNQNQNQIISKDINQYNGDLVFSVPPDVWQDFKKHRIKLKAPMTERAEKLMLKDLEKLYMRGHDPTAVIEQSIKNGYKGVFEINERKKNERNGDGFINACVDP